MLVATGHALRDAQILTMAAAPADHRLRDISEHEVKKAAAPDTLVLEQTPDILKAHEGTLFVRNGKDLHLAMTSKREMAAKIIE